MKILYRLFLLLSLGALPFILESAFELYGLTLVYGPQMLFFSLAHTGGLLVLILFLSAVCAALALLSGLFLLAAYAGGSAEGAVSRRVVLIAVIALAVHITLLMTYNIWSGLGLSRLVCVAALLGLALSLFFGTRAYRLTNAWSGP